MTTADSLGVLALDTATTGHLARTELTEASGAAMSPTQPGVILTINDSGHEPVLYLTDTTGADRGAWRVTQASNADWEAISVGPCDTGGSCAYIGDTGDNDAKRSTRSIYRVIEPLAENAGFTGTTAPAARLRYSYPDAPHDVEAMYVAPNGDILLITKRRLKDAAERLRPALVFLLPASAWTDSTPTVATLVDSLPIVPGSSFGRTITDAALSGDRRHLAVRTYTQVFVFATDPATGRVIATTRPAICNVATLFDIGEGIAWLDDSGTFVFINEGEGAPIYRARCPLPE